MHFTPTHISLLYMHCWLVVESVVFGALLQAVKNVIGQVFSEDRYVTSPLTFIGTFVNHSIWLFALIIEGHVHM